MTLEELKAKADQIDKAQQRRLVAYLAKQLWLLGDEPLQHI